MLYICIWPIKIQFHILLKCLCGELPMPLETVKPVRRTLVNLYSTCSPPVILYHLGLCGAVFTAISLPGPAGVWPASRARSTATHAWSPNPSPSPNGVFLTSRLVGPLQYSNNSNYIFTIIDRTSKWMAAIALSETSAAACTKA
jgi:hypothetical protein